jgi:hypothetical protein
VSLGAPGKYRQFKEDTKVLASDARALFLAIESKLERFITAALGYIKGYLRGLGLRTKRVTDKVAPRVAATPLGP